MSPAKSLLKSRKFLLLLLDTIVSIVVFVATHYLAPAAQEPVLFILGALQPVFVAIIVAISIEDAALKRAGLAYDSKVGGVVGYVADEESGSG